MTQDQVAIPSRIAALARGVQDAMNVTWDEMVGRSRRTRYSQPRKVFAYLLLQNTVLTFQDIGDLLGGRDHSTVLYWVKSVERDKQQVAVLDKLIQDVERRAEECFPQSGSHGAA